MNHRSIISLALACALVALPAVGDTSPVPRPSSSAALVKLAEGLATADLESPTVASDISAQTGAAFAPGMHGNHAVMVAGPGRLSDGTVIDSVELTRQPGVLSRVVVTLEDTPCIDATALSHDLHATNVDSGGLPSPRPADSPVPSRTFYTGSYSGIAGNHRILIGFKHWTPDDAVCASSLVIEQ